MGVTLNNPLALYQFFYILAFVFMFSVFIYLSIKRGYHLRSVLLLLTTIAVFIVIGTRLFTIPIEDWFNALSLQSVHHGNRSSLGGVLFGLIGLLIAQRLFGSKRDILDLFAWLAPLGLAITKLGCLFNGCCFGLPFNGLWGIQYPVTTNAHYTHWFSGGIEGDTLLSLAVHPVQLYESLLLIVIGYVVWKTHKRWKSSYSSMLFALSLYLSLRFGVEFFRDHSVSQFSTTYYLGVWSVQWLMLGLGLLLGLGLWLIEKRLKPKPKPQQRSPYIRSELIFIVSLSSLLYMFRNLLDTFELRVIWIIFIPAITLVIIHLFIENHSKSHRRLVITTLLVPCLVMAQTIPDQTEKVETYKRIDLGGSFGKFTNEVAFDPVATDCGGTSYSTEYFRQVYSIVGAGYSQVKIKNNQMTTFGANVSGGTIKSTNLGTNESRSEFVFSVNPYFKWDSKWFGAGLGAQLGDFRLNKDTRILGTDLEDAQKSYNILPEFHLRVGPNKYFDVDYNYGFLMPSAYPTLVSRISMGSSFGLSHDYGFRYGYIWNLDTSFLSAQALITEHLGFHLMYVFKEENFGLENIDTSGKFVFSLNYRFGHKTN